jgi:hypothetical protein
VEPGRTTSMALALNSADIPPRLQILPALLMPEEEDTICRIRPRLHSQSREVQWRDTSDQANRVGLLTIAEPLNEEEGKTWPCFYYLICTPSVSVPIIGFLTSSLELPLLGEP